jgi:ribosomal protein L36
MSVLFAPVPHALERMGEILTVTLAGQDNAAAKVVKHRGKDSAKPTDETCHLIPRNMCMFVLCPKICLSFCKLAAVISLSVLEALW